MSKNYHHQKIEAKWQQKWFKTNIFRAKDADKKPKYYVLDMFPYPSGSGLHVGHPEGYTATDIISRYLRMTGKNVLHPMGWDAFGLPAENYAIKTQIHPEKSTLKSIKTFKKQIQSLGFSYDWAREVATCLPDYYKWTQWFFSFLYQKGLAYKKAAPVNWCKKCKTVLANEQVVNGKCERCETAVMQKKLDQWFFKITEFIENNGKTSGLIDGLEKIDWPESTKIGQLNWIGRKEWIDISYPIHGTDREIVVSTTRPDTNFGATFVVVAPEHEMWQQKDFIPEKYRAEVKKYIQEATRKTELERLSEGREKTGIFTGLYCINQLTKKMMPIYVTDFVLTTVGTGAVVGVPGHDMRDFEFAQKFRLPIIRVVVGQDGDTSPITQREQVQEGEGTMINSGFLDGLDIHEATRKVMDYLEEKGWGRRTMRYHLRDWLVSRQRYWGAPIPMVFDDKGNEYLIPESELPVILPKDVDFNPKGKSPLIESRSFHNPKDLKRIENKLKKAGKMPKERTIVRREVDTMDTFVCSSWYMWRFMDPKNKKEFCSQKIANKWGPIDLYVGGAEHTVLHLLYARFFCKVLHKYGYIKYDEPFSKLRHQGIILGEDGEKMCKSRGNVINPDATIKEFGADTLRCYEMFMGPFKDMKPWNTQGVQGVYRFLHKVWRLITASRISRQKPDVKTLKIMHQTLKKVTEDIEEFKFNTAISQMMIAMNHLSQLEKVPQAAIETLLTCLYPFAPHMSEELWEMIGHKKMLMTEKWPKFNEKFAKEEIIKLPVQINGRLRATIQVDADIEEEEAFSQAKHDPNVQRHLQGKEIVKEIFVPGKIVNLVVR